MTMLLQLKEAIMRKKKIAQKAKKQRKKNWKSGLQAGCLALGMATAWGGETRGDVISLVSITPTTTISKAFLYYGNNISTADIMSLGTLSAGQTTTFSHTEFYWEDYANAYTEVNGHRPLYVLIGLYGDENNPGVAISFPSADPVTIPKQWSQIFETTKKDYWDYSEAEVIDCVNQGTVGDFLYVYGDNHYGLFDPPPCGTEYGHEGKIVCFSNPTLGGVVTVDVVPEPAAWVLLVTASSALLFWRRDLLRR
jgi:hypothetical protein